MLNYDAPVQVDFVTGDSTRLAIPAHGAALREAGAAFLTEAFHAFGTLSRENRVLRIRNLEPCSEGSTGEKFFLSLDYAAPEPNLPGECFVKFSRDFRDAFRDRRRGELESEIRLAELARHPAFPIAVPRTAFADFHGQSGTGIIITERIPFGRDGIEPAHHKCMDHELRDPPEYYRIILKSLARLAAAHKSGALSPLVETLFPFDPERAAVDDPILYTAPQIVEMTRRYADFAGRHPQLLPENIREPDFIDKFGREALAFLEHQTAIRRYLHADPAYIALSHFNANIDNAWFWRDAAGALQCGLLDWQRARQMNLGYALWGGLCGASLDIWNRQLDDLLTLFITELASHGGPQLDLATLKRHIDLYAATMGLAGLFNAPAIVLQRLPEAATASGPTDPIFTRSEAARSFLHVFTAFMNLWQRHDFGASLQFALKP